MKRAVAILTLLGLACAASAWRSIFASDLTAFHQDVLQSGKGYDKNEMLLQGVMGWLTYKTVEMRLASEVGCGCSLKGGDTSQVYSPVPNPPDIYLWGDSLTEGLKGWVPLGAPERDSFDIYYPAFGQTRMQNNAKSGSTSQVLRRHFDSCAAGAFNKLYPNPPGPGLPDPSNHIQLEFSRATLLIGGNDFVQYEQLLRAVPWLTIFRINNVINNQNRIVTYHQAQGAEIMILSQQPHPSMDYAGWASHITGLGDLGRLQASITNSYGAPIAALTAVVAGGSAANHCLVHTTCLAAGTVSGTVTAGGAVTGGILAHGIISQNASVGAYTRGLLSMTERAFGRGFGKSLFNGQYGWSRQDATWASMQLGPLSLATAALVANARNTRFVNSWLPFMDLGAAAAGQWWVGNPSLYIGPHDHVDWSPVDGVSDSIHFNALGHAMLASLVQNEMIAAGWQTRSRPAGLDGERCYRGPGFTPQTGTPANWTEEPPELPALTDEGVWLLIICFFTGHCTL